jgi:cold shock CspA family protein
MSSESESQLKVETEQEVEIASQTDRLIGQVKWFNNKAGYGFITVSDGESVGKDIFAHFSTIQVGNNNQYKYLVQGEYVEFTLTTSTNTTHEFQATHISGIKGGMLMCETRQSNRSTQPPRARPPVTKTEEIGNVRNTTTRPPARNNRPVSKSSVPTDNEGFQQVRKKRDYVSGPGPSRK